jgi:hypothetical protein
LGSVTSWGREGYGCPFCVKSAVRFRNIDKFFW